MAGCLERCGNYTHPKFRSWEPGQPPFQPCAPFPAVSGNRGPDRASWRRESLRVQPEEGEGVGWAGPASITGNFYIKEKP